MGVKATVFLEEEELEQLLELRDEPDCPAVVIKLVREIEMWQEET